MAGWGHLRPSRRRSPNRLTSQELEAKGEGPRARARSQGRQGRVEAVAERQGGIGKTEPVYSEGFKET